MISQARWRTDDHGAAENAILDPGGLIAQRAARKGRTSVLEGLGSAARPMRRIVMSSFQGMVPGPYPVHAEVVWRGNRIGPFHQFFERTMTLRVRLHNKRVRRRIASNQNLLEMAMISEAPLCDVGTEAHLDSPVGPWQASGHFRTDHA